MATRTRIASIQIRSARTLRRVAETGKFIYKGWVYERTADAPAENMSKVRLPPEELEPDWMENGYSTRKNEKGPKAKPLENPKPVPPKQLSDAGTPMEVKTGAKEKKVKLDPDAILKEMRKLFKAKWLVGDLTSDFNDGTIEEFLESVADEALDMLYGDDDFEAKTLVRASSKGKATLKKEIKQILSTWTKSLTEELQKLSTASTHAEVKTGAKSKKGPIATFMTDMEVSDLFEYFDTKGKKAYYFNLSKEGDDVFVWDHSPSKEEMSAAEEDLKKKYED